MISSRILGYQWLIGAGLLIVSAVPLPASGEQGRGGDGSTPTFEQLSSGFCYLHKKPVKEAFWLFGKFYKSSKMYCDAQGGVLLHREDCALRDPTYKKTLCLRVEDNDNMKKLLTEYERREHIREQRENARGMESRRQEKISKAVHYLNVLGYYKGTSTSIFVIKPAIDKFVESTGVDMNSTFGFNEAIVRDKSGLRTVSDKLLSALQYETLKKKAGQAQAEQKGLKGSSSSSYSSTDSGAEKIWCATKFEVTQQSSEHYCTTMRGSAYTVMAQAEAEHKRLKAASESTYIVSTSVGRAAGG